MALSETDRSATRKNNFENTNCVEDPMQLMEEFCSLYSEKIKKVEEKFGKCPEAKIKVLEEWVNDLTAQNHVLIETVTDLENDAQERVKQIDCLKNEAKESLNQDDSRKEVASKCAEYESKLCECRQSLEESKCSLNKALEDIKNLQKELCETKEECCKIHQENEHLKGLQKKLENLETDLKNKDCLLCELEQENLKLQEMNKNKCAAFSEKASNTCPDNTQLSLLEDELQKLRKCTEKDIKTLHNQRMESDEINEKMKFIREVLKKKDCELQKHIDEEEKLRSEIFKIGEAFKKREEQMKDAYQKVTCQLRAKNEEILRIKNGLPQAGVTQQQIPNIERDFEIEKLKMKLKDVQLVLTGEIADKHDEIRRLKDDIKELEEKLRQSEKQTHYRDEMIKELRKEVKHGRAKESLAEMLGLKGTPRAAMKTKIENLSSQIEELKGLNMSLESRLSECNLPSVLALRSRLNQAEGSLLAMCNKIDYVRRYLENLKGDEELSVKCGIEALLNELRDDVEWNRQTRRNFSLDEGTSVIVINHRSRSLPDNSLHRIPLKSLSEITVASVPNKGAPSIEQVPLETFQDCKTYVQNISDVENNFNETNKTVSEVCISLKILSEGSGDHILKGFGDIIRSYVEGNEELTRLATQVGSLLDLKEEGKEEGIYNLDYLEGNLVELGRYLTKANLVTPSDSDVSKDGFPEKCDEIGILNKKITIVISDSISLICDIKKRNIGLVPSYIKECLQDIMKLFSSIIGNKKKVFEKLVTLQKQQVNFVQSLTEKVSEFNKAFLSHNESCYILKGELQKLYGILLSKENQIKRQCDEIQYLKSLLPTSLNHQNASSSLRKVSSNNDLKVTEKEELIHNLRSLNYTLRRSKISRSSPTINFPENVDEDFTRKIRELDETIGTIKGNLSSILIYLVKNQDKLSEFEEKSRDFVQTLAQAHTAISSFQDIITVGQGEENVNVSSLNKYLDEATFKVEQLLNAVELFLCDSEKPDLNLISETLKRSMMKLVVIGDIIKNNVLQENTLIKTLSDENEVLKNKMKNLEEQFAESFKSNTANTEKDKWIIQELKNDLVNANAALKAINEEYLSLKIEKEDMEIKNQKVMEELQSKISSLQEAASQVKPNETVSNMAWLFSWPQSRHSRNIYDV